MAEVLAATIAAEVSPAGVVGHKHDDVGFFVRRLNAGCDAVKRRARRQQRQAVVLYFFCFHFSFVYFLFWIFVVFCCPPSKRIKFGSFKLITAIFFDDVEQRSSRKWFTEISHAAGGFGLGARFRFVMGGDESKWRNGDFLLNF
jgi:hypothetical protein